MNKHDIMQEFFKFIHIPLLSALLFASPAQCLEPLDENELDHIAGAAGISIIVTSILIQNRNPAMGFNDTNGGTLRANDVELDIEFTTKSHALTIDIYQEPTYGQNILNFSALDMQTDIDLYIDDLEFNSTSIGYLTMDTLDISQADLYMYANNGSGIDASLGIQLEIDQINYTYDTETSIDPESSLIISNIMVADTITGDPLPSYGAGTNPGDTIDTSTWETSGRFQLGSVNPSESLSIDLVADISQYMEREFIIDADGNYTLDPDGLIGDGVSNPYIANPRYDMGAYIDIQISNIEGSIRAQDITIPDGSTGPVAIDGINGYINIEAPGRGYGNDWDLPYYDD